MAVNDQLVTDRYAIYNGDCMDVMQAMPDQSVHMTLYSPPFGGVYMYSGDDRDLSNYATVDGFFEHYEYVVKEIARVTLPGRISAVHCMDIPQGGHANILLDFPGDIIRMHQRNGWHYVARYHVWKEPLTVRNRTMMKSLHHRTMVEGSDRCAIANADYLLMFRRKGDNPIPVVHPTGLMEYAGERRPPSDVLKYRGWTGNQIENRFSHWIWRQYASAFWDDVRLDRVLPFRDAREEDDEKHVHPLQLDVIDRAIVLWSNPGETVLTPFMGVGSEVYGAVRAGRLGIGVELKPSYYRQAVKNMQAVDAELAEQRGLDLFSALESEGQAEAVAE
jgi:DNA modification methylase